MKPTSEYGPADHAVVGAGWGLIICIAFALGYGMITAALNWYTTLIHDEDWNKHWNKRGLIECTAGHLTIKNIDVIGLTKPLQFNDICANSGES